MVKIRGLAWDDWNKRHIQKHQISFPEVEQACQNILTSFTGHQDRILISGKTRNNKIITIILAQKSPGVYYPATARSASRKERRYINERQKEK